MMRKLIFIASLIMLPFLLARSVMALEATKAHKYYICGGDTVLMFLLYKDPKAAGRVPDVLTLNAGKAIADGIHAVQVKNGEVFIGETRCQRAQIKACPIEERSC
jgi:hypothetical protein